MMALFSILLLGFFLGMRHATDPDHMIAVTTIVSRQRSVGRAAVTGIYWGLGHSLTLLIVGGAIIYFGLVIPARLGLSLEFCVALMLIVLGALNLRPALRLARASAAHAHHDGEYVHNHPHGHRAETHGHSEDAVPTARLDRMFGELRTYRAVRPILIGVVHGLAGSAALALLVLPVIQRPVWAMAYLAVFGLGTIAGMMLVTATLAVPFSFTARFNFMQRHFGTAAGALSLGFGVFLAYQIGFVHGLFAS